jgi:hypothetical protein
MTTPAQLESIRAEWLAAPRKARPGQPGRTAVLQRWADTLGCSPSTLYRQLNQLGHRGPKRHRAESLADETNQTPQAIAYRQRREWASILYALQQKSPEGTIPLELCLRSALRPNLQTGEVLLPPSAKDVPLAAYQAIIRDEIIGGRRRKRTRRLNADRANQAWLLDASTSKYLTIERRSDDDEDWILRLWRNPSPASGYKNKPLGPDRHRLVYYGIWEMLTGYKHAAPTVAVGESGLDTMEFLVGAFQRRPDPRDPLHGLPEDLWCDQGPLVKYAATRDLLDRLLDGFDEHVRTGEAYQKERMGGVEQVWARLWRSFEQSLFLHAPAKGRYEIALRDIQARLVEYFAEENARPSRSDPSLSRRDHWLRAINQQGGVRLCPPDPLETIATEKRCKVRQDGTFLWNKIEYEIPDINDCWILARRAIDGSGRVIAEDERTGKRWDVTPAEHLGYDQHRGQRKLPRDQAREIAQALPLPGDVYAPAQEPATAAPAPKPAQTAADNVVRNRFGARQQEARPLADPLDADRYASLTQAMADLYSQLRAPLSAEHHALAEQRLLRDGLRKSAVRDLAAALCAAQRSAG